MSDNIRTDRVIFSFHIVPLFRRSEKYLIYLRLILDRSLTNQIVNYSVAGDVNYKMFTILWRIKLEPFIYLLTKDIIK